MIITIIMVINVFAEMPKNDGTYIYTYLSIKNLGNKPKKKNTLLAEAFPLCFSALYCHSLRGFGCSRFVLVVSVPRKRPLQTAVWDSC